MGSYAFVSPCALPGRGATRGTRDVLRRPALASAAGRRRAHVRAADAYACASTTERAAHFDAAGRFYRAGSAVVRDLGVLAACVHRARTGRAPRVLDACSGSGVRALRYLAEVPAGHVWANDAQTQDADVLRRNVDAAPRAAGATVRVSVEPMEVAFEEVAAAAAAFDVGGDGAPAEDPRFDLVDLDVFGACTLEELRSALRAVRLDGGLLYVSSTDAVSGAGHNDAAAWRAWRARPRPLPAANEQFLRVVVGAAAREARAAGLEIRPLFSYFHRASSTARLMLRVKPDRSIIASHIRGKRPPPVRRPDLGYVAHCTACGENAVIPGEGHPGSAVSCTGCGTSEGSGLVVSGPMWIGRLHNVDFLREMRALARSRKARDREWRPACDVLSRLIDEADQPPLYFELGEIAKRIGNSAPPRQRIADELERRGYSSSAAHSRPKCIKTSAPFAVVLEAAKTAAEDVDAMMIAAENRDLCPQG